MEPKGFLILFAKMKESTSEAEASIGQNSSTYDDTNDDADAAADDDRVKMKMNVVSGDLLLKMCSEA
jgi:hypothetical protein